MAKREIDPFEIGRRGLAIPFREFPIWFACATWPFAAAALAEATRRGLIAVPEAALEPIDWIATAIFDWCWMTALCRSTVLQLVTFPAMRAFWLFLLLSLGLELAWWLFGGLLSILGVAAYLGLVPFTDWSGLGVQLIGILLAVPLVLLAIWASLRLAIWPAHCAATGTLVGPQVIWRGMQDHSFDMLIIIVIMLGPALLLAAGAQFFLPLELGDSAQVAMAIRAATTVVGVYLGGAFAAAALIAYFEIFVVKAPGPRQR